MCKLSTDGAGCLRRSCPYNPPPTQTTGQGLKVTRCSRGTSHTQQADPTSNERGISRSPSPIRTASSPISRGNAGSCCSRYACWSKSDTMQLSSCRAPDEALCGDATVLAGPQLLPVPFPLRQSPPYLPKDDIFPSPPPTRIRRGPCLRHQHEVAPPAPCAPSVEPRLSCLNPRWHTSRLNPRRSVNSLDVAGGVPWPLLPRTEWVTALATSSSHPGWSTVGTLKSLMSPIIL